MTESREEGKADKGRSVATGRSSTIDNIINIFRIVWSHCLEASLKGRGRRS